MSVLPPAGERPKKLGRPPVPQKAAPRTGMTRRPPQGAMTPEQRKVTPAEELAFATVEAEMGGRGALVAALSVAQLPKDLTQVLGMIADPLHDHESLAKICALGNVSLAKLLKTFQEAVRTRGQLLAHARIAARTPDLAAAVIEDAIPGIRSCPRCLGARWVDKPTNDNPDNQVECPECKGTGEVVFLPNHEVQKTALKIAGLLDTGKGAGAGVNVNVLQQTTVQPGDTTQFDGLMTRLDDMIYGQGRDRLRTSRQTAVDGEVEDGD